MDEKKQMSDKEIEDIPIEEISFDDIPQKKLEENPGEAKEATAAKGEVVAENNSEATEKVVEETIEEKAFEASREKIEEAKVAEKSAEGKAFEEEGKESTPEEGTREQVQEAAAPKKAHNRKKLVGIVASVFVALLAIAYGVGVFYYKDHFYHNTKINDIDFSEKTVAEVEQTLTKEVNEYNLMLQERDGVVEYIKGSDIGLQLVFDSSFEDLLKSQNPFGWIVGWFKDSDYRVGSSIQYSQEKLDSSILGLKAMNEVLMIAPQDAYVDWNPKQGYFTNPGVKGTQIDKTILVQEIKNAITSLADTLNFEEKNCYVLQKIDENDERMGKAVAQLNKISQSVVNYNFGGQTEVCNGDTIRNWLSLDENYGVVIDSEKAREYIDTLGDKYNTYKTTRQFTTHGGKVIEITKGDYGWRMNRADMTEDLVATVQQGGAHTKEPLWLQTANTMSAQDWGNTYVEINLSAQYLYFYKDGQIIVESNLVSGNVSAGHTTPGGIYSLKWKEKDRILRGQIQEDGKPEYETPVSFWMPFNGGIGMHDATWRGSFGGSIYLTNGSHGCINLPYSKAEAIYENITSGTPIICYY